MTSDFGQTEAERQNEIAAHRKKEARAQKNANLREWVSIKVRQVLTFAIIATTGVLAFTHREELQQFVTSKCDQLMGAHSGGLQQSALNHENEVNQASQ